MIDLNGKELAQEINDKLKDECIMLKQYGIIPKLVVIYVGDNRASRTYINNKKKSCDYIGIDFREVDIDPTDKTEEGIVLELSRLIYSLNNDVEVDGILIQKPIPKLSKENEIKIMGLIDPMKDVDGFHQINEAKLYENDYNNILFPCTAKGIITLLDHYGIEIEGKNVVIIGRSLIVGKPLAMLFLNRNATVTICHSKSKNIRELTKLADIIVSAVGKSKMIDHSYTSERTQVLIDVGINRDEDGKLCGDMDYKKLKELLTDRSDYPYGSWYKERYITPVPGGVGPMTVASLMENVIETSKRRRKFKDIEGEIL